jgi:PAS domain S-box-containing protein
MIALTGHGDEQTAVDVMKAGAVDYIAKGKLSESVLSTSIERAVRLHRAEQAAHENHEQTRRAEERFRSLVLATNQLVWTTDPQGRVLEDLPLWRAFTGQTQTQVLGHGWLNAIHPEDRVQVEQMWRSSVDDTELFQSEFRVQHLSGGFRWLLARGVPVLDGQAKVREWVGTATDITDQRVAQRERERLLESAQASRCEAERLNRLKDEFLATVSHELRTPLQSILGWARLLRNQGMDQARLEKGMNTIVRNAQAQVQLIDDILDVSRIITGNLRMCPTPVRVSDFVSTAVETVRAAADAKRITLSTTIAPEVDVILADPDRLQQVVWNLLSNAVKFTPSGGSVRLEVVQAERGIVIVVSDTGQGIPLDFLPYVFDRFRQADAASTRHHGGLGLGLAIVRHLVELHGGKVEAQSRGEGQGAVFTVYLPLAPRPLEPAQELHRFDRAAVARLPANDNLALSGRRVLVVDDDADSRELFATLIRESGAEVSTAASADEGLSRLCAERPDVVVSDVSMPQQDGYEFVRRVRSLDGDPSLRSVPAIALTAYARNEDRRRALAAGFHMHVAKPVDPRELVLAISRLIQTQ